MMKQTYKDYVTCLNSFVQNTKPEIEGKVDYEQLIQLAKINSTEGIINYVLLNHPELVDVQYHGYMRKQCYNEIAMYSRRAEQMKSLVGKLDEEGIDHLLFKGFIVREYFPVPELRTFGDIDFVIRKDDRSEVVKDRLKTYHEQTEPLKDYYEAQGKLKVVYGAEELSETTARVEKALGL